MNDKGNPSEDSGSSFSDKEMDENDSNEGLSASDIENVNESDDENDNDSDEDMITSASTEKGTQNKKLKRKSLNTADSPSEKIMKGNDDLRGGRNSQNVEKEGRYIPPHLRNLSSGQDGERQRQLERMRKRLKGLLNRYVFPCRKDGRPETI